jgi:hypothetical protein
MTSTFSSSLERFLDDLLQTPVPGRQFRVHESNTVLNPDPQQAREPGPGQAPAETHGPLLDPYGVPNTVEIFLPEPLSRIQRAGADQPFLYFSQPAPSVGDVSTITLGAGTVWILASELASLGDGNPAGFVALLVLNGTIMLSGTSSAVGQISVPANGSVTLNLKLAASDAPDSKDDVQVSTPLNVSFRFSPSGGRLRSASPARFSAFGTTVQATHSVGTASYDRTFDRLNFSFHLNASSFTIANCPVSFSKLSGTASIAGGFWSLPLNFTTPDTLGAAIGTGGMSLALESGLIIEPPGLEHPVECGKCALVVEPKQAAIGGLGASTAISSDIIGFWAGSRAQVRFPEPFPFRYVLQSDGHQSWALCAPLVATLDRPRTANNESIRVDSTALVHFGYDGAKTRLTINASARAQTTAVFGSFALKNALLGAGEPRRIVAVGTFSDSVITEGTLSVESDLRFILPFLPDPYAVNVVVEPQGLVEAQSSGLFIIQLKWQSSVPPTIDVYLLEKGISKTPIHQALPTYQESTGVDLFDWFAEEDVKESETTPLMRRLKQGGILLLDLSTNVSQFGVCVNLFQEGDASAISVAVADLFLQITNSYLNVMTLPPIQWEPVRDAQTGNVLSYADCGPTGVFAVDSQKLIPVAPRPAIDGLIEGYQGPSNNKVSVRFSLPFAMIAFAELRRSSSTLFPGFFTSPKISQVQPSFAATNMKGGDQISLVAAQPLLSLGPNARSPSLRGVTRQFRTALTNGKKRGDSVIGMEADDTAVFNTTFNQQFGSNNITRSSIPVTRIDISGFGESIFSDWRNPNADPGSISKVLLEASVGRAAKEVVQIFSIVFPWAIRVVRTITIERLKDATVIRHDSGWKAASDGRYDFAAKYPDVQMHPGVVLSCSNVVNIRDVRGVDQTINGVQLRGVRFDCSIAFAGVETGQGGTGVPALNQLGYLQVTQGTFGAAQWSSLLDITGPLGGLVDCVINIGNSGLRMHVHRVGVGATQAPLSATPQFAMTAWGTVIFPRAGQWTFLRTPRVATAAGAVDERLGVPLIRAGASPSPPAASSPYRFANPEDLLRPVPAVDYGILFSTGTQRVQFRRPKIEADGRNQVTSALPPIIADVYAIGAALGPFPRIADCVPFRTDVTYYLAIGSNGNLKLWPDSPYELDPLIRTLWKSSNSTTIVRLGNEEQTDRDGVVIRPAEKAEVTLQIDSEAAIPWTLNIKRTSYSTNDNSDGELMRVSGDIISSAAKPTPQFLNSDVAFGPAASAAAKLMSFLESVGPLPKMDCSVTNPWEVQVGCFVNKSTYEHFGQGPAKKFIESFCDDLEVKIVMIQSDDPSLDLELNITFHIGSPQGPGFFVLVVAGGGFKTDSTGSTYLAKLGFGVGYQTHIGAFGAQASCTVVGQFIKLPQGFDVGGFIVLEAEIDFGIVVASARSEGGLRFRRIDCTHNSKPDHSIWRIWQLTIAVEVHIFWLVDIEFDYQTQSVDLENDGHCDFGPEFV